MYSGAFVYAQHNSTGKIGWAVFTQGVCGSSSMQHVLDCAAMCAMKRSESGSTNPNDYRFTWGVDCFDCVGEDAPKGILSADKLPFASADFGRKNEQLVSHPEGFEVQPIQSLTLQDATDRLEANQVVFSASGCDVAHGGQGSCNGGVWTVNLGVRAWKDIYGPYVRVAPGKYDAYIQVEMTGYANVRHPIDPDAYMQVVYFDAVSNTGSTFHRNGAVTERDYNQYLRENNGVFAVNITTYGAPNGPIDLPHGSNDLEVRAHFHRSVQSVKVKRVWIEKIS